MCKGVKFSRIMSSESESEPHLRRSHSNRGLCRRNQGKTVYVSKKERRRVLENLKDSLEAKKQKSNMCRVTQELTIVLMKLTNLKSKFNQMEEKKNSKHVALGKMMDLVRDDICVLLKKESVSNEEIKLMVKRTQDIEKLMCSIWNKLTYDEGFLNISLGTDAERGDKKEKIILKRPHRQRKVREEIKTRDIEMRPKEGRISPVRSGSREDLKVVRQPSEPKALVEEVPTRDKSTQDLLVKSSSGTRVDVKEQPVVQKSLSTRSRKSSYPYGFKDINMRKDKKSFHDQTVGLVTTHSADDEESTASQETRQKRTNNTILTHTLFRSECVGKDLCNPPSKRKANLKNLEHNKVLYSSSEVDIGLGSSCIFEQLTDEKARKKRGVKSKKASVDNDSSDSSVSEREFQIKAKVPKESGHSQFVLRNDPDMSADTAKHSLHKKTSYDDFVLDPKFSWNCPHVGDISRKRFVIDQKTWRYTESVYDTVLDLDPKSPEKRFYKCRGTCTAEIPNHKKNNCTQTEDVFANGIQHVCFLRVFYTNTNVGLFQSENSNLKFPKGASIIDKSEAGGNFSYITCRADPTNGLAHFTMILNNGDDASLAQDSVLKLTKVRDMWLEKMKQFFSQMKKNCSPDENHNNFLNGTESGDSKTANQEVISDQFSSDSIGFTNNRDISSNTI